MQQLENENNDTNQQSQKKIKRITKLEDDLGVAAIFLALGVILHFFAPDTNTPSWDGFYQFLSYFFYAISFFGAAYGIDKHSKKEVFSDISLGVAFGIIAYWVHAGVTKLRNISTAEAVLVEFLFMLCVALTAYGLVRGFTRIIIHPRQEAIQNTESTYIPENSKRERLAGYILAFLSLLFGFIQALPIIIEYLKTILPLH